jgi:hypothetical protein
MFGACKLYKLAFRSTKVVAIPQLPIVLATE